MTATLILSTYYIQLLQVYIGDETSIFNSVKFWYILKYVFKCNTLLCYWNKLPNNVTIYWNMYSNVIQYYVIEINC